MTDHTNTVPGIARRLTLALTLGLFRLPEAQVIGALALAWAAIR